MEVDEMSFEINRGALAVFLLGGLLIGTSIISAMDAPKQVEATLDSIAAAIYQIWNGVWDNWNTLKTLDARTYSIDNKINDIDNKITNNAQQSLNLLASMGTVELHSLLVEEIMQKYNVDEYTAKKALANGTIIIEQNPIITINDKSQASTIRNVYCGIAHFHLNGQLMNVSGCSSQLILPYDSGTVMTQPGSSDWTVHCWDSPCPGGVGWHYCCQWREDSAPICVNSQCTNGHIRSDQLPEVYK